MLPMPLHCALAETDKPVINTAARLITLIARQIFISIFLLNHPARSGLLLKVSREPPGKYKDATTKVNCFDFTVACQFQIITAMNTIETFGSCQESVQMKTIHALHTKLHEEKLFLHSCDLVWLRGFSFLLSLSCSFISTNLLHASNRATANFTPSFISCSFQRSQFVRPRGGGSGA